MLTRMQPKWNEPTTSPPPPQTGLHDRLPNAPTLVAFQVRSLGNLVTCKVAR